MGLFRKIVVGVLLATSAAVLLVAALELWNYRQWAYLPSGEPVTPDSRARLLQDRLDLMSKRVGDMELLVLILLGTSGLYAIVFVASSYATANGFARQADRTLRHVRDEIGLAMGDLRELQEKTEQRLREMAVTPAAPAAVTPAEQPGQEATTDAAMPETSAELEAEIAGIAARLAGYREPAMGEEFRLELIQHEKTMAGLELIAGLHAGSAILSALAGVYLAFGRIFAASDAPRSRFYLERALRLTSHETATASEIHYELACGYADAHDFVRAMGELKAAFEHQVKSLDERLVTDIDEGGKFYELASTPPFDKAVNDLLLNVSIGIG